MPIPTLSFRSATRWASSARLAERYWRMWCSPTVGANPGQNDKVTPPTSGDLIDQDELAGIWRGSPSWSVFAVSSDQTYRIGLSFSQAQGLKPLPQPLA